MSIFDCLGSVFGGSSKITCAMGAMRMADFQEATARQWGASQRNLFVLPPHRTLPAGIFWERTGGKTHRVTIRRSPEAVYDLSVFGIVVSTETSIGYKITGNTVNNMGPMSLHGIALTPQPREKPNAADQRE